MQPSSSLLRSTLAAFAAAVLGFSLPAAAQLPAPAPKAPEKKYVPYRITRADILSVEVLANADREFAATGKRVEATGMINLQFIQDIRVANLTIAEAQEAIANAYRDGRFIRNPVVNVTVETYAPRVVRISGKVNSQATYEIPPDTEMTIMELIFKANGFTDTAQDKDVRVTRTMPDGSLKVFRLNVGDAIKGKLKDVAAASGDAAFVLQPDDVVYVPERII